MAKTLHLLLLFTLLFFAGGGIAKAEEVTIDLTAQGFSNQEKITTVKSDPITLAFDKGTSKSTYPAYFSSKNPKGVRLYSGNTLNIDAGNGNIITKVVFTFSVTGNTTTSSFKVDAGNFDSSSSSWSGNVQKFTISNSSSGSGNAGFTKIVVTYTPTGPAKTKTTLSFGDNANKTFNLNATEGLTFTQTATLTPAIADAQISYSSDNTDIATVDASTGAVTVTPTKDGKATITATYAGDNTYDAATVSYTITIKDPNQPRWVKTDISSLTSTDQFVIVDVNSKAAMSNDNGTSKAPAAVDVTLSDDGTEITSTIADNLKWNVSSTTDGYKFYPNGSTTTWLYNDSKTSVKVGTSTTNNVFKEYSSTTYSGLQNTGTNRYLYVSSSKDWRCYASTTSTSIAYFKRYAAGEKVKTATKITFEKENQVFDQNVKDGLAEVLNTATVTTADGKAIDGAEVKYTSSDDNNAPVGNDGNVTVDISKVGSYTITATYAGDDTYAASEASYTITVEESLNLTGAGTEEDPYTVADALTVINKGETAKHGTGVYVKGIISQIDEVSTKYKNATYYISDDGNTTTQLQVFRGKYIDGADFTTEDQIAVGDIVLVKGDISLYNKTPEVNQSNTLVKFYEREMSFDEKADLDVKAGHNVTVTLTRTFNDNAWNTLVVPFDLTSEQVTEGFGSDAKLAKYIGTTATADGTYTLNFQTTTTVTANEPVFVYGAVGEAFLVNGLTVKVGTPTLAPASAAFSFMGTYANTTVSKNDWFISSDNNFYYSSTGTEALKPMRAVFRPTTTAAAKGLSMSIDGGAPTAISTISADGIVIDPTAPVYNLAGQRVGKDYKGIVVRNGHKYINK